MNEFKEFRKQTGLNLTEFSKRFNIPYRTVQNWEYGISNPPEYLLELIKQVWRDHKEAEKC